MSEGGVNPEELHSAPNQPDKSRFKQTWEKVARFFRRTKPSENMQVESRGYTPENDFNIPTGSGYDVLIMSSGENIGRYLRNLYPDFLQMLIPGENSYSNDPNGVPIFNMQITEGWQVGIKESDRIRLMEELQKGNKKVIAVLAYYLTDKCNESNLPVMQQLFKGEKPRDARLRVGRAANNIMHEMQNSLEKSGQQFFAMNERANWQNILAPEEAVNPNLGSALREAQQIIDTRS